MKKTMYLLALVAMLAACKNSRNTYDARFEVNGCVYEYHIEYPEGIDYAIVERYVALDIADDNRSIVALMDSLIDEDVHLDYWCDKYFNAMAETMPYDSILPRLLKLSDREPSNPAVYCNIGYIYSHLGDTLKAFENYQKTLDIAPDCSQYWYCLGTAKIQYGDTVSAIDCLTKSLELAQKHNIESQAVRIQITLDSIASNTTITAK